MSEPKQEDRVERPIIKWDYHDAELAVGTIGFTRYNKPVTARVSIVYTPGGLRPVVEVRDDRQAFLESKAGATHRYMQDAVDEATNMVARMMV